MTKFVIQSGGMKKYPDKAEAYFAELLADLGPEVKLLWCFFATLPDDPEVRFKQYTKQYQPLFPNDLLVTHKNATVENFVEEVAWANVVYIHGGLVSTLLEHFKDLDLYKMFAGKSIGANSASSLILSDVFWDADYRKVMQGLNILPMKFIAHYDSDYGSDDPRGPIDWNSVKNELQNIKPELPTHTPKEGEFIVECL